MPADLTAILPDEKVLHKTEWNHLLGNNGDITVFPTTEEEISEVVRYASDHGKKISIIGGGTKRGFGGLSDSADIQLSLSNYKGITEHTPGDMTVTVRAGTPFKELQSFLAQFGQMVSLDPSWPEHATIGGIVAANESGPKRLGYGSARDSVIGLRIVYPDGKVIRSGGRVVKNVAGYDMNKLFVGSMGTLGVLSEVTLKLRPLPACQSLVLLSYPEEMQEAMRTFSVQLLDSALEPVALELLNPALSKRLTGQKMNTLAVSFEDFEPSVRYQEEVLKKMVPEHVQMAILPEVETVKFWERFYTAAPNAYTRKPGSVTEASLKVGLKNLDVFNLMEIVAKSAGTSPEAHGGLGHGLSKVHLRGSSQDVLAMIEAVRALAKDLGGYAIVTHLPYAMRHKTEVWGEKPDYFFLIEGIKKAVDPYSVLNDKRYLGGI
ncbi:FAD-binding oxidoreductase [Bacillus sp. FSL H8-0547]